MLRSSGAIRRRRCTSSVRPQRRVDPIQWLDGGAYFYICGDAKAMAKDVRAALVRAYADVKALSPEAAEQVVATHEREKRYLQDTH